MSEESAPKQRYSIEWSGMLPAQALSILGDGEQRAFFDAADRREIDAILERRSAAGQVILRTPAGELPPLYRYCSFEATSTSLALRLGRTDYGEYLFSNVEHPERRALRGAEAMSDALAACAVLVTGDGLALFAQRSSKIADLEPGQRRYHVIPAGHPEPPGGLVDGLFGELEEETGVRRNEVQRAFLTGLIRALPSGKPELTFLLETALAFDEIRQRVARDRWEYEALEGFPWTPEGIQGWLRKHRNDAVAPGFAAVELGQARARATL